MRHQRVQESWSSYLGAICSRTFLEHWNICWIIEHPVPSSLAFSCSCRNILSLINEFDFPELSISRDEYPSVLMYLNATQPERVARLPLKTCHLEDFLDKVPTGTGREDTSLGNQGHLGCIQSCKRLGTFPTGNYKKNTSNYLHLADRMTSA